MSDISTEATMKLSIFSTVENEGQPATLLLNAFSFSTVI
jgi:hypothetical protein